jgi:hypothetical protein
MPVTVNELAALKGRDPYLHSIVDKIVKFVNLLGKSTGVAPPGHLPTPPTIGGIQVTAANGFFDISLTDKAVVQPGIVYFVEFDSSSNFQNAHTVSLGAARHLHLGLGNQTLYFRAYSMYQASGVRSPIVVLGGTNPVAKTGGGAAGPTLSPAQGSGTSQIPGYGFGPTPRSKNSITI